MKGYNTSNGYMGYVEGKYILFWSRKMKKLNIYKLCWWSYDFDEFELRRFIVRSRV